ALKAIAKNPSFTLGTAEHYRVVAAYGKLIGNASSDTETEQYVVNVLKQYNDNLSTYVTDDAKGQAVYEIVQGIDYD
ncbi:M9 family metallopeptidase N-terminal domain-containing protein, partial [Bacillus cereus]|nr:M9 family metallopeptidase N-terminal domain-containing protein [Bacillus cereus]